MNRLAPLLFAVMVVFAWTACGSSHRSAATTGVTTTTVPTATSLHIYAPFNGGTIATGVKIAKTARGYCWTVSDADGRSDAWRCFLGNEILDPCFSNEAGTSPFVLCAESPWSSVVKLKLTKPLPLAQANPETGNPTARPPWAVQLTDGTQCVAVTGAVGAIAGLGLDYGCAGGAVLAGRPNRGNSTWKIFYASSFKAKTLAERSITEAWW